MGKTVAVFGGSFNPPHVWHGLIVRRLAKQFEEVVVVPCGQRRDKRSTGDIDPLHRAAMCDMAFGDCPGVRVDHFDLEREEFSTNVELQERFGQGGNEVWHVIGSDLLMPVKDGKCVIRSKWRDGERIWNEFKWLVIVRPGYGLPRGSEMPKNYSVVGVPLQVGSSTDIRRRMFERQSVDGLVAPVVAAYAERHNLYRGHQESSATCLPIPEPKPFVRPDPYNERSLKIADALKGVSVPIEQANCIVVVGGDGTMLRAVNEHWRRRVPFVGFNTGHVGYLLNRLLCHQEDRPEALLEAIAKEPLVCHQLPLLRAIFTRADDGLKSEAYAFNDFWLERASTPPIVMEITIQGNGWRDWRIAEAVGDGVLMATAAGSTAYAMAMGAVPLSVATPQTWLMIGNNIGRPDGGIRQLPLDRNTSIAILVKHTDSRPARLCADTGGIANVKSVLVAMSRIAAAEIAFLRETDLSAKLLDQRFSRGS